MAQLTYRSQRVAYAYFLAALLLFALQIAFGFLSLAKYLGPDPLLDVLNFATAKAIHTNLLLVWLLTGFMGAAYFLVPEESRTRAPQRAARLRRSSALWLAIGVVTIGRATCSAITEGRKFLEMPLPLKLGVVVVMLIFLYNVAHDDPEGRALHHHRGRAGRRPRRRPRCSSCPGLIHLRQLHARLASTAGGSCTCGSRASGS